MELNYILHENIAPLAWCMKIREDEIIDVHIGSSCECRTDFFVSGVWDGEFLDADFDKAEFFCGSGAKLYKGGVLVCTSSHERERLCYIKGEKCIYISNSVPFILAITNKKLEINRYDYESIFCSIMDGIDKYVKEIPLNNEEIMYQIFYSNLYIESNLEINNVSKIGHKDFNDYDDYYNSLIKVMTKLVTNACSSDRNMKYGMVSTVSSGYDSSAAAAVAKKMGCSKTITFGGEKYKKDSGIEIAKQLGYIDNVERDVNNYKKIKGYVDAICCSNGDQGSSLEFCVFSEDMKNNLVFVGDNGDHMWGIDTFVGDTLGRDSSFPYYQACLSHAEYSLFNNHIIIPVALYGGSVYPSIHNITVSEEMEPWRMHNSYDRPIPRRIVEDQGVDRNIFGQEKRGGGSSFAKNFTISQVKRKMTYEGFDAFQLWLNDKANNPHNLKRIIRYIRYHIGMMPEYFNYINVKILKNKIPYSFCEKRGKIVNPGIPSRLIIWGIEKTSEIYKENL